MTPTFLRVTLSFLLLTVSTAYAEQHTVRFENQ